MSKMSKAIAVLGVVAGLGVAAMPLSSYAASNQDAKDAVVQVTVGGGISLTIVDPAEVTQTSNAKLDLDTRTLDLGEAKLGGAIVEGSLGVKVATNDPSGYTLKMTAKNGTAMSGAAGTIPAGTPTVGSSAWGFKIGNAADWETLADAGYDIYSGADATTTGNTSAGNDADNPIVPAVQTTDVTFGVSASATQPEGDYATTVTFTATVK